ncbi:MAG: ATP-binding protein [Synergistaceae bacterium]|nr:ATP-binding protein [Synergistaceae bacterium]
MNSNRKLKSRDLYLNKLIAFKDTEPVKIITGIRRCGKSSLLKLLVEYLKENGVEGSQIVEMNFESNDYKNMTSDEVYSFVKEKCYKKRAYLFFDEIQRIDKWEDAINALRVDLDCDIYVTGSNAYLLSSEYATYLSGRCVEIKMLPLSFKEFIQFNDFELKKVKSALRGEKNIIIDVNAIQYALSEVFESYLHFGGMPGIADVGLEQDKAFALLDGIYSTVVVRDILEREKRRGQRQITDSLLLKKIILFLCDNIGSSVSSSSIGNTLVAEGLLENGSRKGRPSTHTIQAYIEALVEAYFFYNIKRFDIRGKELLKTLGKYYVVDIGLRNYLLGLRDRDRGHILENIVYLELLRRGYDVAIGKLDDMEIDFIATNATDKLYVQVTESMIEETVRKRELTPLQKVSDNYEKIILTMNDGQVTYDGIKQINLVDWLLA